MNLASVLVCIVIIFLLCNLPRLVINLAEFLMSSSINQCPDFKPPSWVICLTSFMHLTLVINSSSNFIIYAFMGTLFQKVERGKCSKLIYNIYNCRS